jgi:hypothetical protein
LPSQAKVKSFSSPLRSQKNLINIFGGGIAGTKNEFFVTKSRKIGSGNDSSKNTLFSFSETFRKYYKLIFLFLVLILFYYLYYYTSYLSGNVLVRNQINLKDGSRKIESTKMDNPASTTSSYSIWVYLNNKVTAINKKGTIFQLNNNSGFQTYESGGKANSSNSVFALYINDNNELIFTDKTTTFTIIPIFPIQKWTNIFINIYQLQYYECYINGKLVNTFKQIADNVNKPTATSTITLGGDNPPITISNLKRWSHIKDSATIWNSFVKDNRINSSYETNIPINDDNIANRVVNMVNTHAITNYLV